ncbi:hypothetical protein WJX74_003172 [Apatococcus lobatus]|uniref:3-dehydroquinate synthase, chloroplastic n=1 Tax=Apatococcus lobatus TaxID=904363 RepID=A0AAW1RP11_9CHLO
MVAGELGPCSATLDRPVPTVASFSGRPHPLLVHRNKSGCRVSAASQQTRRVRAATVQAQVASAEAPAIPKPGTLPPKIVNVDLGDRSYPIYIGEALLNDAEIVSRHVQGSQILVVTNTTVAPLYLESFVKGLREQGAFKVESVILPDGEEHKSLQVLQQVWDKALESRLDRKATFVALGGGVIGDMTGFAAAAYQRGASFIQVPTTVMAMVDSSVGGKTGVNHPLGKNMIGAFYQPRCVLADMETLKSLPDRELASGISEIVKYGLIFDPELFNWLEENVEKLLNRDSKAMMHAIDRSCAIKADIVALDEREGGVRATLNLGHTFGHAIEAAQGYGVWLHGEAVAAGMVMAADMSFRLGWIEPEICKRTVELLKRAKQPITPPKGMTAEQFRSFMSVDKKVQDGKLRLVLLRGPLGNCTVTGDFDPQILEDTISAFVAHEGISGSSDLPNTQ